jgi:hypothetical protein
VPRDKAIKQLDELKRQFDEDIQIAQELGLKMGKQLTEFQDANNKILDKDSNSRAILNAEKLSLASSKKENAVMPEMVKNSKKKSKKHNKAYQPSTAAVVNKSAGKTQVPVAKPPAVEVAHVTETNQIKQKAFVDQIDKAKSQAKVAFALEGSVSLAEPENLLCAL